MSDALESTVNSNRSGNPWRTRRRIGRGVVVGVSDEREVGLAVPAVHRLERRALARLAVEALRDHLRIGAVAVSPCDYAFYYAPIVGFDAYEAGKAKTIAGISTAGRCPESRSS
jgi:hypothetical protein